MSDFPFVLIVGPTASGKSDLALNLAQKFGGAILNCDSVQTYQRLNIGSAKPSAQEMQRRPHFLFDILKPGEVLTAGDFRKAALTVLQAQLPKQIVFGVGGSGFYIQALEKGMFDVPKPSQAADQAVRERLKLQGLPALYAELQKRDPKYADALNPNDAYRITRALILMDDSGKTVTEVRRSFTAKPFPYPLLKLGLLPAREILLERVQQRTKYMLAAGLIDEVKVLVKEGFSDWPALASVGYAQCLEFVQGKLPRAELESKIIERTMQLAKKQRTWFKRDPEIKWLSPENAVEEGKIEVTRFLDQCKRSS